MGEKTRLMISNARFEFLGVRTCPVKTVIVETCRTARRKAAAIIEFENRPPEKGRCTRIAGGDCDSVHRLA